MSGTTFHIALSVRGALGWSRRELRNATKWIRRDDGTSYTPDALHNALMDELASGHEVLPMGDACDNFDYKHGCRGHRSTEPASSPASASLKNADSHSQAPGEREG